MMVKIQSSQDLMALPVTYTTVQAWTVCRFLVMLKTQGGGWSSEVKHLPRMLKYSKKS